MSWFLLVLTLAFGASSLSGAPGPSRAFGENIGIDQRVGGTIPPDLFLRDEAGARVALAEVMGDRPALLVPVYFECPMLCSLTLNEVLRATRSLSLDAGRDFTVVAFSFDSREGAALATAKRETYVRAYGRPGTAGGWRFLTGTEESLRRLTEAIGFRYVKDPDGTDFAHAAAVVVLTPEGRISRYLLGSEYRPRDVRLALAEAGGGRIGSVVDQVLLFCFRYDAHQGRYTPAIMNLVRAGGAGTFALIVFGVARQIRRERRRAARRT